MRASFVRRLSCSASRTSCGEPAVAIMRCPSATTVRRAASNQSQSCQSTCLVAALPWLRPVWAARVGTSSLTEVLRTWTGFLSPELSRLSSLKLERRPSTESAKASFHHALAQAPYVDNLDTLMDVVRTRNMECEPPLSDV